MVCRDFEPELDLHYKRNEVRIRVLLTKQLKQKNIDKLNSIEILDTSPCNNEEKLGRSAAADILLS